MRGKQLEQLREAISAIEGGGHSAGPQVPGPSGLPMPPGVHEWFGLTGADGLPWLPPLGVVLHLARRSLETPSARRVVWIGRRCWPYPRALGEDDPLLRRSIFIDPPDQGCRLWAIDLAVRCPAAAAVVADGSGLDLAATRRLQLAAEAGSALVLLARPPGERDRLSAAATRWLVCSAPSADKTPRWIVELLRSKGAQLDSALRLTGGMSGGPGAGFREPGRRWALEWKRAQGSLVVSAALLDRSGPATRSKRLDRCSA